MTDEANLTQAEEQVVADEAAAEVVYQHDLADAEFDRLPYTTQQVVKAQAAEALAAKNAGGKS